MTMVLLAIGALGCYVGSAVLLVTARHAHPPSRPEWNPTPLERGLRRIKRLLGLVLTVAVIALIVTALRSVPARSEAPPTTSAPAPYEYIPTPAGPPSGSPQGGDR